MRRPLVERRMINEVTKRDFYLMSKYSIYAIFNCKIDWKNLATLNFAIPFYWLRQN